MRGLPHAFRAVEAREGTAVEVQIRGEAGKSWFLQQLNARWQLTGPAARPEAVVGIDQELAWRVFTKAVAASDAAKEATLSVDRSLALRVLSLFTVIA